MLQHFENTIVLKLLSFVLIITWPFSELLPHLSNKKMKYVPTFTPDLKIIAFMILHEKKCVILGMSVPSVSKAI